MSELIIDDYKKEFTNNFIKDEESLIQFLIKKRVIIINLFQVMMQILK